MTYNIALQFEDGVTRFIHCKPGEKVADAAGLPLSKAFTENVRAGGKLGGNSQLH